MLTKAVLSDDVGGEVTFQFNPEKISFTSAAHVPGEESTKQSQYVGPKAIELSLRMLLDEVFGDEPVAARLETLLKWTRPKDDQNNPFEVTFTWGTLKIGDKIGLKCHCESVAVEYQLFSPEGAPVRASATVKLKEIIPETASQNPTSGGLQPARSHTLRRQEDLAVLAHSEYGTTSTWRDVARHNAIDNPFRLPLGRELIFPSRLDLDR